MALEKCVTYYCIAWCISWKPHQSLSLGRAWRFWLVELSHKSSPNQASEPAAGSHSSCRSFHGKGCCRKASILIGNGRERWGWTERGRRDEKGNKTRRLENNSIFETRHVCNYNEAAWELELRTETCRPVVPLNSPRWSASRLLWGRRVREVFDSRPELSAQSRMQIIALFSMEQKKQRIM